MAAFLHASLFCASFVSSRCCFKSLRTLFIQLILGLTLPRGLFPPAFTAVTCFATFVSYLLIMFVRGQFQWRFWVTFDDSGFDKCLLDGVLPALIDDVAEKVKKNPFVSLMLKHNASEYLLCTLEHNRLLQQPLDLTFSPGEPIGFFLHGSGMLCGVRTVSKSPNICWTNRGRILIDCIVCH